MFALVLPGNAGNQRPTGAGNPNVTKLPVNQPKLYKSRCMRVGNGLVKDAHAISRRDASSEDDNDLEKAIRP
jgi:hypothetical protein